jgi:DNA-binding transcriptional MerR regulator
VAETLGISKRTLFRYEKKGIFPRPERNPVNGFRRYSLEDIKELKQILGQDEE